MKGAKRDTVIIFEGAGRRVELNVAELSPEIQQRLAVYGAYVKLSRAAAGLKTDEERIAAVERTANALREGRWMDRPEGAGKKSKKEAVLAEIRQQPKELRPALVKALEAAGILRRLKITEQEIKEALEA